MIITKRVVPVSQFGYQVILDDSKKIVGMNLVLGESILLKKQYAKPIIILSQRELDKFAYQFVQKTLNKLFSGYKSDTTCV